MTPREALEIAKAAGRTGQFDVACDHANRKHNVTRNDIARGLATATSATHQPENDRWKLEGGHDIDDDDLTLIVAFEDGVIVVTAF